MSDAAPVPAAEEARPAPPPSLGGLLDLFFFLLLAVALFLLVQFVALYAVAQGARARQPHVEWPELLRQVAEDVQYSAFYIIPVQTIFQVLLLLLLYALVRGRRGLPFWSSLAVHALPARHILPAAGAGLLLALVVQFSNVLIPPPEPLPIDRLFTTRGAAWLIVGASLLVAPFAEELVFRGYIYSLLERRWNIPTAVLGSGILFGAIHFPQLFPGYFQMLLLCGVGVVFSLARARTGTTVASMLLHVGYNGAISTLFLLSPQFRALPAGF
ncbi:MAG: CPBP family intramembrane metalloprotease [Acidobacteria bacterium]|nr:CPBP family intramembrane metalloprotease [Acidobacteriota bacterium]